MTIRHFTASALVFDAEGRVLLVFHRKAGVWLYPGGHLDDNEDPLAGAIRETREETGVEAEPVDVPLFTHPAVVSYPRPFVVLEMDVRDSKVGEHRHIDPVYVLRAVTTAISPQLEEVDAARWVPVADVASLPTPPELPALVAAAAMWVKAQA
ncbi:NUDIX domain-containing protein [Catellatospora sp. NPDC049609]|uniref:NUDIX hydrolase n=1 Tax=Catellatospora sp. NPDC049609 TaxID=3155505 RepID=UPI003436E0D2